MIIFCRFRHPTVYEPAHIIWEETFPIKPYQTCTMRVDGSIKNPYSLRYINVTIVERIRTNRPYHGIKLYGPIHEKTIGTKHADHS